MKNFLHNILGWGFPNGLKEADSFQPTYKCRFCDKSITQDSTGAWFHLTT